MFSQDDAHIFCTPEQIEDEVFGCLDFGYSIYDRLGLEIKVELSTRPENKIGTDEEWDVAEAALAAALERRGHRVLGQRRATAPSTGRRSTCTCSTRSAAPGRSGRCSSTSRCRSASGSATRAPTTPSTRPVMIHRALIGSFERFIGILIEHFAGAFPFWLAPVQVRVIPVGLDHHDAGARARGAARRLPRRGRRLRRDRRQADPQRRGRQDPVRDRLRRQGDRDDALAVREHGGGQSTKSLPELLESLATLSA